MTLPVNYRVKWTANQRLDLADLADDQAGAMKRLGSAMLGISSYSSSNAVGAKGEVFSGFNITQGPGTRTVRITGEGMAVDADGNMIFKTTVSDPFTTTLAAAPYTHIVHAYYTEADSTNAARRFWTNGVEETQTVATHVESTVGLYVTSADPTANPVDSDGSGHPTIALWRVRFDGDTLVVLEDLRPRQQVLAPGPVANGALDSTAFVMVNNVESIDTWTRGANSSLDALTITPSAANLSSVILMLDNTWKFPSGSTSPALRFWYRPKDTGGTMYETGSFVGNEALNIFSPAGTGIFLGAGQLPDDVTIGDDTKTITLRAPTTVSDLDHAAQGGTLTLGGTTANAVEVGRSGHTTTVKGDFVVEGNYESGFVVSGLVDNSNGSLVTSAGSVGLITGATKVQTGIYQIIITGMTASAIVLATGYLGSVFGVAALNVTVLPQEGHLFVYTYNSQSGAHHDANFSFHVVQL